MITKYAIAEILWSEVFDEDSSKPLTKSAHRADFDYVDRKEGFLYVRSRAISSRTNDNYDDFPAEEIKKAYKTFVGKPVFVNHHNSNHKRARGVIKAAEIHEDKNPDGTDDTWVEVLMEVDAIKFPKLAEAILAGHINRTSMGCDVVASTCTYCGNRAETPLQYCGHIRAQKGQRLPRKTRDGKEEMVLVAEICEGLSFFENSLLVEEPADPTAFVLGVESGMAKAASKQSKITEIEPDGSEPVDEWYCDECGNFIGWGLYDDGDRERPHWFLTFFDSATGERLCEDCAYYREGDSIWSEGSIDPSWDYVIPERYREFGGTRIELTRGYMGMTPGSKGTVVRGPTESGLYIVQMDAISSGALTTLTEDQFKPVKEGSLIRVAGFEDAFRIAGQGMRDRWDAGEGLTGLTDDEWNRIKSELQSAADSGNVGARLELETYRNIEARWIEPRFLYGLATRLGLDNAYELIYGPKTANLVEAAFQVIDTETGEQVSGLFDSLRDVTARGYDPSADISDAINSGTLDIYEPSLPEHYNYLIEFYQEQGFTLEQAERMAGEDVRSTHFPRRDSGGTIMSKLAFGEQKAPAKIDTMREELCPICGSEFDGQSCYVCLYQKPPDEFMDPDLERAQQVDLRQEEGEGVTLAEKVGAEVYDDGHVEIGEPHPIEDPEAEVEGEGEGILENPEEIEGEVGEAIGEGVDLDELEETQKQDAQESLDESAEVLETEEAIEEELEGESDTEEAEDIGEPFGDDELFGEDEDLEDDSDSEESEPEAAESSEADEDAPSESEVGDDEELPSDEDDGQDEDDEDDEASEDENNIYSSEEDSENSDTVEPSATPSESVDIDVEFDGDDQKELSEDFESLIGDAENEDDEDDEEDDDDFPPGGKMTAKNAQRVAPQKDRTQRVAPTPSAARFAARQQAVINAQGVQIRQLRFALAVMAKAAGLSKHPAFAALVKRAEDENPAQPEGFAVEPATEDAPIVTSEETLGFDNEQTADATQGLEEVEEIGETDEADVAPDATTSLAKRRQVARQRAAAAAAARKKKAVEVVLDEPLDLNEEDVTEQVAGTEDLGEGPAGEAGSGRTEIDPVEDPVAINNPDTMFDTAEEGWELSAKKGEERTYAALRLARLRIQAGIAQGDDLGLANEIVKSRVTTREINAEANVLDKVVKNQRQQTSRTRPTQRSARRSAPSLQEPGQILVTASGNDDEWLFE